MALTPILNTVVSTISAVTGIGRVFDYVRWSAQDADFERWAVTGGKVSVWQVTRLATEERWLTGGSMWESHVLAIYGYYGVDDANASERTFQDLIERLRLRFRTTSMITLNGNAESIAPYFGPMASSSDRDGSRAGVQVETIDHRNFHNVLVHFAELRLAVQESPQALD